MLKFLFCGLCAVVVSRLSGGDGADGALIELSGPACGTLICKADEYCNQYSHGCEACKSICDPTNHNFDELKCKDQCEVYIYDQRYFKRTPDGSDDGNLRAVVQTLQLKYTVALALVIIVIVVLVIVFAIFIWQWKSNNGVTWASFHQKISRKKSENNTNGVTATKVANDQGGRKQDLRLEITPSSVQSEPTPVTVTTGVTTRIPAEDSIDYAYDNPAMSNSPKKSGSTTN